MALATLTTPKPYPVDPFKNDWKIWEADVLVNCGLKHQLVTVYLPESGDIHQSFLYGFDLQASQLLLDGLYPWPTKALRMKDSFWLQIRCEHGFFNLHVELQEIDGHHASEFLTVKVLTTELTHNRRWNTRVYFEPRKGPEVELQLDNYPLIKAQVANLSRHGALLEVYGKDIKADTTNRLLNGNFKFNDYFHMPLDCVIKQSRFLRSPCCHTQIRLQFSRISEDDQAKLDTFIHAVSNSLPENRLTAEWAVAS